MNRLILLLAFIVSSFINMLADTHTDSSLSVKHLTIEGRTAYEGLDLAHPRLGWQIESKHPCTVQKSYRIIVSTSLRNVQNQIGDMWDTGVVNSSQSQWIDYRGKTLMPNTRYFWRVLINTRDACVISNAGSWSMGLMDESNWKGNWIGTDSLMPWDCNTKFSKVSARYLRKTFACTKPIQRATVHVCGLGIYTLDVDGQRIGHGDVLTPVGTDFLKKVVYDTYDVSSLFTASPARHALLLTLEAGQFFAVRQQYQINARQTYGLPKARLNLILEYTDGTKETIATDATWKLNADGPVRYANYYDGELYDARKELTGASLPDYPDNTWREAEIVEAPQGKLVGNITPNMHVYECTPPVSTHQYGNRFILDFGTNGAGRLRLRTHTKDTLTIRYAELLRQDGKSLYTDNLRSAKSTDYFVGDGQAHDFTSEYTYHGFRYAEIRGKDIDTSSIRRELIADRMDDTGTELTTDNSMLNRLIANARRGIRSNYKGMPVDCPQRDERMPWLGDRTTGCLGESYLMNNYSLYAKWLQDICDSQRDDGNISDVSPNYWKLYTDNVTWPAALPFAADMIYRQYGDSLPMIQVYPNVKRFLHYMRTKYGRNGIITKDKYGDWCVPPEDAKTILSKDSTRITDGNLISSCYYYYLCKMMSKYAHLQNKDSDALYYEKESVLTRTAINNTFLGADGYSNNTVTANLLPLAMYIAPEDKIPAIRQTLIRTITEKNDTCLSAGIIGIQWLMRYLSDSGHSDIAWKLATTDRYPSWGYMASKGATTIWELWNGDTASPEMNSGNHVMLLGDLLPWCYEYIGGIRPLENGFRRIQLKPDFSIQQLNHVDCSHPSPYGVIKSKWDRTGHHILWNVQIPVNTSAEVCFPNGKIKKVESGSYTFEWKSE